MAPVDDRVEHGRGRDRSRTNQNCSQTNNNSHKENNNVETKRDRAQLVLVGALTLAVSLVVLAVVLNSAIYTENLASRSGESGVGTAADVRESVRDGVGGATDRVNQNHAGDDYATLYGTHLSTAMAEWEPMVARQLVVSGRTLRVTESGGMEGTRIADESEGHFTPSASSGFESGYGEYDWMVASAVKVRNFRLSEVSASDLTSASASFDPETAGTFFVEVHERDGSDEWQVALYDDDGSVGVMVWDEDQESAVGSCQTDSSATIDLTGATLDGQSCEALSFFDETQRPLDVYYVNGDAVVGTYELTVDRAGHETNDALKDRVDSENYGRHCAGPTYADGPGDGSPYASAAVYSATVDFRYVSESMTYETDVRAARGEPGPAADHPLVTDLDVTDNSETDDDDDASFEVSWEVADPNADLDSVTVELRQGESVADSSSADVGGASDSGSVTVFESDGGDETYTVAVEVTDEDGHARTNSETHAADGTTGTGCPQ